MCFLWLVVFLTINWGFRIFEIWRYGWRDEFILKHTLQVNKFSSFLYKSNFMKRLWWFVSESINGRRACWEWHLLNSATSYNGWFIRRIYNPIGRELKNDSIGCRPFLVNSFEKAFNKVVVLLTAILFRLLFPFCHKPWDLRLRNSKREYPSKSVILEILPSYLCPSFPLMSGMGFGFWLCHSWSFFITLTKKAAWSDR